MPLPLGASVLVVEGTDPPPLEAGEEPLGPLGPPLPLGAPRDCWLMMSDDGKARAGV